MTRNKRIFWTIILHIFPFNARQIAGIFRKYKLFGSVGENCLIQLRKMPLYSELIHIHNNVIIGSDIHFDTHDASYIMLNNKLGNNNVVEKVGCIEIMDNVFIGASTHILNNVRIGNNVIIGACSYVTRDIPDNSVYSGNPAKFICTFDDYLDMVMDDSETFKSSYGIDIISRVDSDLAKKLYCDFVKAKDKKKRK